MSWENACKPLTNVTQYLTLSIIKLSPASNFLKIPDFLHEVLQIF